MFDVVVETPLDPPCIRREITHVYMTFIKPPMKKGDDGKQVVDQVELKSIMSQVKAGNLISASNLTDSDQEYSGADDEEWKSADIQVKVQVLVVVIGHSGNDFDDLDWEWLADFAGGARNVMALGCKVPSGSKAAEFAWHSEGTVVISMQRAAHIGQIAESGDVADVFKNSNKHEKELGLNGWKEIVPPEE